MPTCPGTHPTSTSRIRLSSTSSSETTPANTEAEKENGNSKNTVYPPLSREEVQELLDQVPLYTVSDPNGLVLLKQNSTDTSTGTSTIQELANFYFFPENANAKYSALKQSTNNPLVAADWQITQCPMGVIWMELTAVDAAQDKGGEEIQHRVVPNQFEIVMAQKWTSSEAALFQSAFNEIPVFSDATLPTQLHLGHQDFMTAAKSRNAPGHKPTVQVMDLATLANQLLTQESDLDFRTAKFVPPTLPSERETSIGTNDLWN